MSVLQALDGYYQRLFDRGEVVPPGWSIEPLGLRLVLHPDGSVAEPLALRDPSGKKGKPERVPKWFGRAGQGSTPFFLWDNTGYALGVTNKPGDKVARDHAAFRQLHLEQLAEETDEGLVALRKFLELWSPEQFGQHFEQNQVDQNVGFQLAGDRGLLHLRPAAQALVEKLRQPKDATNVFCLVTGTDGPGVRLHPKVKGVDGTSIAEVPLVSFNEPAFESYGKEQGWNAPTSEAAAFQYTAALTRLLDRDTGNRLKVADTVIAYWADASGGEAQAVAAERRFRKIANPTDQQEATKVRDRLEQVGKGRPALDFDPGVKPTTRFHILGLAPNAARIAVRYWLSSSFGEIEDHLRRHYADIDLDPAPWRTLPSVQRLLVNSTALQNEFKNIPNGLTGEVLRAVLEGRPYPRTLLAAAIMRLRAGDSPAAGWHAAVIKACLNRLSSKEQMPVALEPTHDSQAYQLGRLFAVLEAAQKAALGQVNASIVDRYYGSASATPARVFGPLLRNVRNHVSDAQKRGKGGWIEPRLGEIMGRLKPDLPTALGIEDQGRFAVGYYHERWRGLGGGEKPKADPDDNNPDSEGSE